jgi:hypothetical protein
MRVPSGLERFTDRSMDVRKLTQMGFERTGRRMVIYAAWPAGCSRTLALAAG